MIDMYLRLIKDSEGWNLNRVPTKYCYEVQVELTKQGYDENGNKVA